MVQHVTTEGTSDAVPTPDLASLMLTAMSLGCTRTPAPTISGANTRTTTTSGAANARTTTTSGAANARATTTPVGNMRTSATSQHPVVANVTSIPSSGTSAPVAAVVGASANTSQKWYCVTVGRQVGVFQGPENVISLVTGISGACYPRHSSRASAQAAFDRAYAEGKVEVRT
ncbi:hypothetical protein PILCRDRAFT_94024 [Piloderma croceum F 1598]|uniref:Ribonuclease H1 N-terminal domain-containing protein n=1 Tax=Piloderma croceum (strain F 1598) TaxID=765440 RepID=A0A0C3ABG6_PILCF|nr:hypothetical protein PILCRDRAFT_94024 [Piloderma croceum F 1598]